MSSSSNRIELSSDTSTASPMDRVGKKIPGTPYFKGTFRKQSIPRSSGATAPVNNSPKTSPKLKVKRGQSPSLKDKVVFFDALSSPSQKPDVSDSDDEASDPLDDRFEINSKRIDSAAIVLFVLSTPALESSDCADEIHYAYEGRKPLVNLQYLKQGIDRKLLTGSMGMMLQNAETVDLFQYPTMEGALWDLVAVLAVHMCDVHSTEIAVGGEMGGGNGGNRGVAGGEGLELSPRGCINHRVRPEEEQVAIREDALKRSAEYQTLVKQSQVLNSNPIAAPAEGVPNGTVELVSLPDQTSETTSVDMLGGSPWKRPRLPPPGSMSPAAEAAAEVFAAVAKVVKDGDHDHLDVPNPKRPERLVISGDSDATRILLEANPHAFSDPTPRLYRGQSYPAGSVERLDVKPKKMTKREHVRHLSLGQYEPLPALPSGHSLTVSLHPRSRRGSSEGPEFQPPHHVHYSSALPHPMSRATSALTTYINPQAAILGPTSRSVPHTPREVEGLANGIISSSANGDLASTGSSPDPTRISAQPLTTGSNPTTIAKSPANRGLSSAPETHVHENGVQQGANATSKWREPEGLKTSSPIEPSVRRASESYTNMRERWDKMLPNDLRKFLQQSPDWRAGRKAPPSPPTGGGRRIRLASEDRVGNSSTGGGTWLQNFRYRSSRTPKRDEKGKPYHASTPGSDTATKRFHPPPAHLRRRANSLTSDYLQGIPLSTLKSAKSSPDVSGMRERFEMTPSTGARRLSLRTSNRSVEPYNHDDVARSSVGFKVDPKSSDKKSPPDGERLMRHASANEFTGSPPRRGVHSHALTQPGLAQFLRHAQPNPQMSQLPQLQSSPQLSPPQQLEPVQRSSDRRSASEISAKKSTGSYDSSPVVRIGVLGTPSPQNASATKSQTRRHTNLDDEGRVNHRTSPKTSQPGHHGDTTPRALGPSSTPSSGGSEKHQRPIGAQLAIDDLRAGGLSSRRRRNARLSGYNGPNSIFLFNGSPPGKQPDSVSESRQAIGTQRMPRSSNIEDLGKGATASLSPLIESPAIDLKQPVSATHEAPVLKTHSSRAPQSTEDEPKQSQ